MPATSISSDRKSARPVVVQQYVRLENVHHLEGVLNTFGEIAQYQDEALGDCYPARDESVRTTNSSWRHCLTSKFKSASSISLTTTFC
jgi:hypothetical protein